MPGNLAHTQEKTVQITVDACYFVPAIFKNNALFKGAEARAQHFKFGSGESDCAIRANGITFPNRRFVHRVNIADTEFGSGMNRDTVYYPVVPRTFYL